MRTEKGNRGAPMPGAMAMKAMWFLIGLLLASGAASAATVQVDVGHDDGQAHASYFQYFPRTVVVQQGDTVQWTSYSDDPHTVTEGAPHTWSDRSYKPLFDSSPAFGADPSIFRVLFGPGGFLQPGQSYSHTYNQTGDFAYRCKVHPGMEGWVHVVNATSSPLGSTVPPPSIPQNEVYVDAGSGSGDTSVDRFGPDNITVRVGTTVVWTNKHDTEVHTVTSNSTAEKFDSSPDVPDFANNQIPPDLAPAFVGPGGTMLEGVNSRFNMTFDQPGTWQYRCKLHTGMTGVVVVLPRDDDAQYAVKGGAGGTTPGGNSSGAVTTNAGSRVPGFGAPLLAGALALVALAVRRTR